MFACLIYIFFQLEILNKNSFKKSNGNIKLNVSWKFELKNMEKIFL